MRNIYQWNINQKKTEANEKLPGTLVRDKRESHRRHINHKCICNETKFMLLNLSDT
jgi:hypothetical protein